MRCGSTCGWILLLTLFVAITCGHAQTPGNEDKDFEFFPNHNDWPLLVYLPVPIRADELQQYARILSLSEAQLFAIARWHEDYRAEYSRILHPRLSTLRQDAQIAADGYRQGTPNAETFPAVARYIKAQQQLSSELVEVETDLLARIEAILAEIQLPEMPRVRMHRDRARTGSAVSERVTAAARCDLGHILQEMTLTEEEWRAVDPLVREYEVALSPMWRQYDHGMLDRSLRSAEIGHHMLFGMTGPAAAAALHEIFAESARLESRILQINTQYLQSIGGVLTTPRRDEFRLRFFAQAYPAILPDPCDPVPIVRSVVESPGVSPELKKAVSEQLAAFQSRYDAIVLNMVREIDEGKLKFAATRCDPDIVGHQHRMFALQKQRWLLEENLLDQLVRLDVDGALLAFRDRIAAVKARIGQLRGLLESHQLPSQ